MDLIKFDKLKQEYENYYDSFLKQGKFPLGETSIGFWAASITDEIVELFSKINLKDYKSFIDLGSGDGKVVLIASLLNIKSTGVEHDKDLIKKSNEVKNKLNLNANFIQDDFNNININEFDIIFVNTDKPFERGLESKLLKELKGKLIVYGAQFHPKQLKKEKSIFINGTEIGIYSNQKS